MKHYKSFLVSVLALIFQIQSLTLMDLVQQDQKVHVVVMPSCYN